MSAAGQALFIFGATLCVMLAVFARASRSPDTLQAAKFCAVLWGFVALSGLAIWVIAA